MEKKSFRSTLKNLGACSEAVQWVGTKTLAVGWRTCTRGDWMLWLAARAGIDRKKIVLAACACARLVLQFLPTDELRPLTAIETAERWARGKATLDEVNIAANAAAYAANAANAAAYAAYAAYAAEYAAYAAAYAANAANAANAAS